MSSNGNLFFCKSLGTMKLCFILQLVDYCEVVGFMGIAFLGAIGT